ncbi:MAG: hypothetical protein V3G42_15285 [Oscillospiraceae bacterium]
MKYRLSEQECLDVSSIMALMAEQKDMPAEYSAVMKRGASLLRQAVRFCTLFCQSYNNLKERYEKEEMLNDPDDEAD